MTTSEYELNFFYLNAWKIYLKINFIFLKSLYSSSFFHKKKNAKCTCDFKNYQLKRYFNLNFIIFDKESVNRQVMYFLSFIYKEFYINLN